MAKKTTRKRASNSVPTQTPRSEMLKYQAEDDLRTLQRAAEIQGDKSRMTRAQRVAKQQMSALERVAGPPRKR